MAGHDSGSTWQRAPGKGGDYRALVGYSQEVEPVRKLLLALAVSASLLVPTAAVAAPKDTAPPPGAIPVTEGETTRVWCSYPSNQVVADTGTATYYTKNGKEIVTLPGTEVSFGGAVDYGPAPRKSAYVVVSGMTCVIFRYHYQVSVNIAGGDTHVHECPSGYRVVEAAVLRQSWNGSTPGELPVVVTVSPTGESASFYNPNSFAVDTYYRVVCEYIR